MDNKDLIQLKHEENKQKIDELKKIAKILDKPGFRHPHIAANGQSYRADLKQRLDEYMTAVDELNIDDSKISDEVGKLKPQLQLICNHLIEAVNAYLSGNYGDAYVQIDALFENGNRHLLQKLISGQNLSRKQYLYRVRPSNNYLHELGDLFHIPFNLRHLVSGQRYSIPGVPSLYLGASLYVCWQEMSYPDLNSLYISNFALRNETSEGSRTKLLNLAFSLNNLTSGLESDDDNINEVIAARIILYPLVIASSYTRANENSSFNEEYIIPSLLLQWVNRNKEIAGISYFSTKRNLESYDEKLVNYVFPTKVEDNTPASQGFCSALVQMFQFTPPIAWQFLDAQDLVQRGDPSKNSAYDYNRYYTDINATTNFSTDDFFCNYSRTNFGRQEEKLANMPFTTLDQPLNSSEFE